MFKPSLKVIPLVLSTLLLVACQKETPPQPDELTMLKQELGQLKQDIRMMASKVNDIHRVAMASTTPQYKTLPTQDNIDDNGQLPTLGDDDAKMAIIEFSDYQCPYCKRYIDQTFPLLKTQYIDTGKLKYIARDFPLNFHPKAKGAAMTANCSLQQNAYWPMRDLLFNNIRSLGDKLYQDSASELSLDIKQFTECLSAPGTLTKIEQDVAYGSSLGIRGTPSFLVGNIENNRIINPKLIVGAQNYQTFNTIIEALQSPSSDQ
ncbi:DsbA family protein [Shewanella algidipiscicola]|uniref:Thioredoxin n=1 Tax=Shewanella algidipiscicola TaxID=614070 RepID=A0ABQ4PGU9_9GAMM|nr:thioredoxin domain-containing protein [Shewanella algidipiscicola]GIU46644.1 thioredoxin [Shewanella algidipiscicola]